MANIARMVVQTELGESLRELRKVRTEFGHMQKEATTTGAHIRGALKGGLIVGAAAAGVAIAGVTEEMKKAFEAASAYQVAQKRLEVATQNAGVSWKKYGKSIDETITKQSDMSGFMRTDMIDSFSKLVTTTGSQTKAFHLQAEAMDLARARGLTLQQASVVLSKVYNGNTTSLSRYGIALPKVTAAQDALKASGQKATAAQVAQAKAADMAASRTAALAALQQKFGGQTAAYAKTSQGQIARFHVSVEELQTTLGRILLPLVSKVFGTFANWMNQLQSSKAVRDAFNAGVSAMAVVVKDVGDVTSQFIADFRRDWPQIRVIIAAGVAWAKQNLVPIWHSIFNGMRQIALNVVAAVQSNWPLIQQTMKAVWAVIGPILHDFFIVVRQVLIPAIVLLSKTIGPALKIVLIAVKDTFQVAGPILTHAADLVTGFLLAAKHIAGSLPGVWGTIKKDAVGAWQSIVNTVDGFINHLISGYDWVAGKIGIPKIPELPIYASAGGGGGGGGSRPTGRRTAATGMVQPQPGGTVIVGEAGHREAVLSLNPAHRERTLGLVAEVVRAVTPRMSLGGIASTIGGAVGSGVGAIGGAIGSVAGFLNPLSHLPSLPHFGGALASFGSAIVHKIYEGVKSKILSVAGSFFGGGGGGGGALLPGGIGATHAPGEPVWNATVLGWLRAAMSLTATPQTPTNIGLLLARAWQESSWNPRAINLTDSNAAAGHPSKGWFQTIDPTFQSYMVPGHGDIWNPVDNAAAAIRYMRAGYHHLVGYTGVGYANGGYVHGPMGAPQRAVVHGGELVLTPQQQRMLGGITIIINGADLSTPEQRRRIAADLGPELQRRWASMAGG